MNVDKMRKHDVCRMIRGFGLTCVWRSEWQEYCINYRLYDTRRHGDDSSYHTNDSKDAIETAWLMSTYK